MGTQRRRMTQKEIVDLVKDGVAQELNASNTEIAKKLKKLTDLVQGLPQAPSAAAGTGDGAAVTSGADGAARPA